MKPDLKFINLCSLYKELKWEDRTNERFRLCSLTVDNMDQLALLKNLLGEPREYGLSLISPDSPEEISVGAKIQLQAGDPRVGLGLLADNLDNVLKFTHGKIKAPSFYLIDPPWASSNDNPPDIVIRYRLVINQINVLVEGGAYLDKDKQQLVFIDSAKFVLPICYDMGDLSKLSQQAGNEILARLDQDIHREQKLVILIGVVKSLCSIAPEGDRFKHFLNNLQAVLKEFDEGYKLFVAGFSYEKIVDEMEDAKLEELAKIHRTFSDIQNQILSIPVATVIVATQIKSTSKVGTILWVNTAILVGAIIFVVLTYLLLKNQRQTLDEIGQEIDRKREQIERDYSAIKDVTEKSMGSLKKRLRAQRRAFRAVEIIVTIGLFMTLFMYLKLTEPVCMWILHILEALSVRLSWS